MSEIEELRESLAWVLAFANDHGRGPYYDSFNYATQTRTWSCLGCNGIAVIPNNEPFSFNHTEDCKWMLAVRRSQEGAAEKP